ncbi:hypothetical protein D3C81_1754550 [compost metagenome]
MPVIDRMSFVFIICVIFMVIISLIDNKRGIVPKGLEIDTKMFKAHNGFVIGSLLVVMIVVALYSIYW